MNVFTNLLTIIREQNRLLKNIAEKLKQLELGGGAGNAIADYEVGKTYKRNTLLVDPATETVYRVLPSQYVSISGTDGFLTSFTACGLSFFSVIFLEGENALKNPSSNMSWLLFI